VIRPFCPVGEGLGRGWDCVLPASSRLCGVWVSSWWPHRPLGTRAHPLLCKLVIGVSALAPAVPHPLTYLRSAPMSVTL
jgi:hypothetical protein